MKNVLSEANTGTVDCGALKGGPTSSDFLPPGAPPGLAGTPSASPVSIVLTWSPASDDTVWYRVFNRRRRDNVLVATVSWVYRDGAVIATVGVPGYTDSTVAARTKYRYSVTAADAVGTESELSSTVSVKTSR